MKLNVPEVQLVPIDQLKPWAKNPRKGHAVKAIARSIESFGYLSPIIVQKGTMRVLAGHGRLAALRKQNVTEVPVLVADLDEKERMLLTVRINRAKGSHIALRMSDLVQRLLELGCTEAYIAEQIGATDREIEILKKGDIFSAIDLSGWEYSKAWLPKPYKAKERAEAPKEPGMALE